MRRGAVVTIGALMLGCGRVAFDARAGDAGGDAAADAAAVAPDACPPAGHDEDGDGLDDACDPCPQDAAVTVDVDGDGVGDACDPDTAVAHARTLFDPFTGPTADWLYDPRIGWLGDSMAFPITTDFATAALLRAPGRAAYEIAGSAGSSGATGDRQILLSFGPSGPGAYYCELFDGLAGHELKLTYTFDGVGYVAVSTAPLPGRLEAGRFRLVVVHDRPRVRCALTWRGVAYEVAGDVPLTLLPGDRVILGVANVSTEVEYATRVDLR